MYWSYHSLALSHWYSWHILLSVIQLCLQWILALAVPAQTLKHHSMCPLDAIIMPVLARPRLPQLQPARPTRPHWLLHHQGLVCAHSHQRRSRRLSWQGWKRGCQVQWTPRFTTCMLKVWAYLLAVGGTQLQGHRQQEMEVHKQKLILAVGHL